MSSCHDDDDNDDDDGNDNVSVQSPVSPRFADVSAQVSLSCFCLFTKHSWILGQAKHAVFLLIHTELFQSPYMGVQFHLGVGIYIYTHTYMYIYRQMISVSVYQRIYI